MQVSEELSDVLPDISIFNSCVPVVPEVEIKQ